MNLTYSNPFPLLKAQITGDFFQEWNKITPKIHIRKFKEQTACWESFLTSTGSSQTQMILWMSEMTLSKASVLNSYILQIFGCEFGE